MNNEQELLLCCVRSQINSKSTPIIRDLVKQNLDWQYLVKTAQSHKVIPSLYWQLQEICPELVPQDILQQLKNAFSENTLKNMALTGELIKIIKLFKEQKIPVLAFKGPVLAQIAYDKLNLRQFIDLDILILESDIAKATQLLINQGYQLQFNLTEQQQLIYLKRNYERSFWHQEKCIFVDLHCSILPKYFSFAPDIKLIWEGLTQVNFGNYKIPTLSPENLLLYLCAHGSKDSWSSLHLIVDVAQLLNNSPDLDWDYITSKVGKLGTYTMLFLGLCLTHDLFGILLPSNILQQLTVKSEIIELSTQVQEQLFKEKIKSTNPSIKDTIYRKTIESVRDKISYWVVHLFAPTPFEWSMVILPKWLFFLYFPIRIIRLTLKYTILKI